MNIWKEKLRINDRKKGKSQQVWHENQQEFEADDADVFVTFAGISVSPCCARAEVLNLSLTVYPFSIPTDDHEPLQHFNR